MNIKRWKMNRRYICLLVRSTDISLMNTRYLFMTSSLVKNIALHVYYSIGEIVFDNEQISPIFVIFVIIAFMTAISCNLYIQSIQQTTMT